MTRLTTVIYASLTALFLSDVLAATRLMPLDEVKAGMTGVGITVFQGIKREEFDVHVLGVLRNVMGPRRNVIVARLEGGPLGETGVIQGMSGSPIYIDDRLIGALSYSLGSFSTQAIAGITPIEEMIDTDTHPITVASGGTASLALPLTRESFSTLVGNTFNPSLPFALQPADVELLGLAPALGTSLGPLLRPIATPLVLTGFVPEMHDLWASAFNARGFVTTIGSSVAGEQNSSSSPLVAGDAVGVALITGDISMAGTGTVTMVEESRVYAFGHPFYNLGTANFPMTRARVTTLLPSLALSSKIAAIGDVVGRIDQDRATGIFGSLGPGPRMIPVRLSLSSPDREIHQIFNFQVIDDRVFTPLLTYTSVLNAFLSWTRELGPTTYSVDSVTRLRDHDDVSFRDMYSGDAALVTAATSISAPLTALLSNHFEFVTVENIDVKIIAREEPLTATLQRIWLDTTRPRAGDQVPLKVVSRNSRGEEIVDTLLMDIPINASGSMQILVSDAAHLQQTDIQEGRGSQASDSLTQIIRTLNRKRRNNHLYVRLLIPKSGAVVKGQALPALPSSVLAVLTSDLANSGSIPLKEAILGEWEIETNYTVSGSRLITINVETG